MIYAIESSKDYTLGAKPVRMAGTLVALMAGLLITKFVREAAVTAYEGLLSKYKNLFGASLNSKKPRNSQPKNISRTPYLYQMDQNDTEILNSFKTAANSLALMVTFF